MDAFGIALALYWQWVEDMTRASEQQLWAFLRNLQAADFALWRDVTERMTRTVPPLIIDADGAMIPREWASI